jgi:hypothetical protein
MSNATHLTVELHVASAAVLLELLLEEHPSASSDPPVTYSQAWHRREAIDALRIAIREWGGTST